MNLLETIDLMTWKEYLIFMSVFLGLVNLFAWYLLMQKEKRNRKLQMVVEKIMSQALSPKVADGKAKFNLTNHGIIDGGVLIALFGVAMIAFISGRETVSNKAVVNREEIKIENSVYQCREIRRKTIHYYDVTTGTYKLLPTKPTQGCK